MRILLAFLFCLLTFPAFAERPVVYGFTEDGLFKGAAKAHMDPLDGGPLVGKRQTLKKPPALRKGFRPKFDQKAQKWSEVEFHLGKKVYSTTDGSEVELRPSNPRMPYKYGPIPDGYTLKPRPTPEYDWDTTKKDWVLNQVRADAVAAEVAKAKAFSNDEDRKALRDKLESATPTQIKKYVDGLFPNMTAAQKRFLSALIMLHK